MIVVILTLVSSLTTLVARDTFDSQKLGILWLVHPPFMADFIVIQSSR